MVIVMWKKEPRETHNENEKNEMENEEKLS